MEEAKPSKELQSLYSKKGKEQAEKERSKALEAVSTDSSDDEEDPDEFDYDDDKKKKAKEKESRFGKGDPKKQLVKYLETKSEVVNVKIFQCVMDLLGNFT